MLGPGEGIQPHPFMRLEIRPTCHVRVKQRRGPGPVFGRRGNLEHARHGFQALRGIEQAARLARLRVPLPCRGERKEVRRIQMVLEIFSTLSIKYLIKNRLVGE